MWLKEEKWICILNMFAEKERRRFTSNKKKEGSFELR